MHSLRVCCALCFALVLVFGFSSKLYAQADPVVSFNYQEESLEKILREWKRVYELRFAYDPAICHEVFITAYGTGLAPAEALDVLLEQTPLTWKQIGSTYAIYVRPPEENINPTRAVVSWGSKVLDQETREPVAFATVRIAGTTLGTHTDDEGRFFIRDIPSDTSTLVITYVGYQVLRYKLTPEKFDQREPLLISRSTGLMPQAIVYGDQTSLVQSTPEPGLMEVSTLDLNSIGSAGEPDAMKAAQLLPGVDATSEGAGGLLVRGAEPDQSRVTMDGFSLYHLDHFFGLYSAFNPQIIESVRVHKGHASAGEGGFTGGWVEMVSRDGNRQRASTRIDLGLLTASALTEGPIGKKASYLIAARRSYTDALFSPLYQSLFNNIYNANIPEVDAGQVNVFEGEDAPTFGFFDLNAKFSFHLKERDRLTFTLMRSADRLDMRFVQSADALSRQITYNDQSRWGNTGMSVRYNHHWTDSTHTEFQAGGSAFNSELFSEDRVRNLLTGIEEVDLSEEENLLEDYSAKLAHHFYVKQKKALIGLQTNRIGSGHVERDLTDTLEAWLHAAFAEVTTRTRIGSEVTGGMRVYAYSVTSRLYADPRLTISQEVNEYGSIRAAFSVSHQFLQRLQPQNFALNNPDYWQLSDGDDIPVLTAFQLSLGLRWSKNGWTIDGELYGRSTDGVKRGYAHTDSGDSNRFVTGNSSATGFDLLVQRDFGRHHVWLASSTVMSNFSDSTNSVIPESSVHNQELKLIYQVKLDKVEISAAWFFGSGKPYTPLLGTYTQPLINGDQQVLPVFGAINSGLLPVYHRLDISIARHFVTGKTKGSLKLNFFNIYDRQNIRNFQYYAITGEDDEFASGTRAVAMLGFSPSINLSITF